VRGGRAGAQDGRDPGQAGGGDGGRDPAGQLIRRRRTADRPKAGSKDVRVLICKRLGSPGIDSKESKPICSTGPPVLDFLNNLWGLGTK
jgi:hypothetical protein